MKKHEKNRIRWNIYLVKDLARINGGKLLSQYYTNNNELLVWKCKKGHVWKASLSNVHYNTWCPVCARNVPYTMKQMQEIARKKQGKCLSTHYTNKHSPLKWQCKFGHTWSIAFSQIQRGLWCPTCRKPGRSEAICREYFEKVFNNKFPKTWPEWLINSKGNRMELDGYCKELGIAFEYQGKQHYNNIKYFHKIHNLNVRSEFDEIKRTLCKKHNITLIEVPYTIKYENLQAYIITKCKEKGMKIQSKKKNFDFHQFNIYSQDKIKEYKKIAKEREGKLLSKKYVNKKTKLLWQCKKRHKWYATPQKIQIGQWCPKCGFKRFIQHSKSRTLTIQDMNESAKKHGGICLSKKYKSANTKLRWQCKKRHIWTTKPAHIRSGHWCPICAKNKKR